jgi:hypothetical protein
MKPKVVYSLIKIGFLVGLYIIKRYECEEQFFYGKTRDIYNTICFNTDQPKVVKSFFFIYASNICQMICCPSIPIRCKLIELSYKLKLLLKVMEMNIIGIPTLAINSLIDQANIINFLWYLYEIKIITYEISQIYI